MTLVWPVSPDSTRGPGDAARNAEHVKRWFSQGDCVKPTEKQVQEAREWAQMKVDVFLLELLRDHAEIESAPAAVGRLTGAPRTPYDERLRERAGTPVRLEVSVPCHVKGADGVERVQHLNLYVMVPAAVPDDTLPLWRRSKRVYGDESDAALAKAQAALQVLVDSFDITGKS